MKKKISIHTAIGINIVGMTHCMVWHNENSIRYKHQALDASLPISTLVVISKLIIPVERSSVWKDIAGPF